jgi:hypothetical protein
MRKESATVRHFFEFVKGGGEVPEIVALKEKVQEWLVSFHTQHKKMWMRHRHCHCQGVPGELTT